MDSKLIIGIAVVAVLGIGAVLLTSSGPDPIETTPPPGTPSGEPMPGSGTDTSPPADSVPPPDTNSRTEDQGMEAEGNMEMDMQIVE